METNVKNQITLTYPTGLPMSAWAEDDIPSNKLLVKGTNAMSNSELLSVIIGNGIEGDNSLDIARRLLAHCDNNLCELWRMGVTELKQIKGIGEKKAVQIVSVFALARRRNESEIMVRDKIVSSQDAYRIFQNVIQDIPYEEFWILLLNRANRVVNKVRISEGGVAGTVVDPKKVFKVAIENYSPAILLGHNHPSGNCTPSEQDLRLTRQLVDAGKLIDILVLDHIVVGNDQYYSFSDEGKI
jgi:DNA repair protein RadC